MVSGNDTCVRSPGNDGRLVINLERKGSIHRVRQAWVTHAFSGANGSFIFEKLGHRCLVADPSPRAFSSSVVKA
jgi:hypothetical protein